MFCINCGKELVGKSTFCPSCGAKIDSGIGQKTLEEKTIKLRCKDCNGIMEVDANNQQLVCPYCGSKELIIDSDAVAVEKIRSNTYKEIEYERIKHEKEKEQKKEIKETRDAYWKSRFSKITITFTAICLLAMFVAFSDKQILAGLIALIQTCLLASSWLMGMQIIKEKKNALHKALAVLAFILIIPFIMWSNNQKPDKLDWPTTGIATNIPKPSTKYGNIITNRENSFYASLEKVSQSDYNKYIELCKGMGYTLESNSDTNGYEAFNADGYKLQILYFSNEDMSICLDAPMDGKEFTWPKNDIAKLIPHPQSNVGKIEWERDDGFVIYVANTTKEDFVAYAESCADAGFTVNYNKGDTYYSADNSDGYHVDLKYEGNSTMSVRIDKPDKKESSASDTKNTTSEEKETDANNQPTSDNNEASNTSEESTLESDDYEELVDGMRPSFKEAMDAYEEFYVEYCELLKSYNANPTDMSLLSKYTNMIIKAEEVDKKFNAWENDDLNEAELKYYTNVNLRVLQMLTDVD
ncbi:MAG: zinc-ribbon domain-containing protein [Lachnospiraceae bacterium]|nr:zinc-ribbon domain-containing protein [Lachnospiraceae bacterium]